MLLDAGFKQCSNDSSFLHLLTLYYSLHSQARSLIVLEKPSVLLALISFQLQVFEIEENLFLMTPPNP
jgi:hypothetical protein